MKLIGPDATSDDKRQALCVSNLESSFEDAATEASSRQTRDPLSLAWDVRHLLQNIRTALPLVACDQFVLVGAVLVATRGIQMFGAAHVIS